MVGVGVGWVTGVLLLYVCITSRLPIIAKLINIRVVVVANTRCYDDMTHDRRRQRYVRKKECINTTCTHLETARNINLVNLICDINIMASWF